MIELSHITKVFNRGQINEVTALHDLSLQIAEGEFIALIGANGSGKTTLLNIISGAIRPSTGNIIIHEADITSLPEHKRSRWVARVFKTRWPARRPI
jgi:putative ABC transport system ATP-binding protein